MDDISSKDLAIEIAKKIAEYYFNAAKSIGFGTDDSPVVLGKKELSDMLKRLYSSSLRDDYYFFDCPVTVYKNTLDKRFGEFKEVNVDAERVDFIESEIMKLYRPDSCRIILTENYHAFSQEIDGFKTTIKKKKAFLKDELKNEGRYMSNGPVENGSPYDEVPLDDNVRFDKIVVKGIKDKSMMLTSRQIVILLDKVGFFTDNKIQKKSQTKQANLISKLTGFNVKNIKTYISELGVKKSKIGDNYQKDIDTIDSLLNDI